MEKADTNTVEPEFIPPFLNGESEFDDIEGTENGLCLSNVYIPEEIILHIFTFVEPKELLRNCLVCQKWNNMIKSHVLWTQIFKKKYNRKPKKLPWYIYYCLLSTDNFDTNFILNGNGQEQFKYWNITSDGGDKCIIEDPPAGADLLPLDVPEFNNKTSCFATSYGTCCKSQQIIFKGSKLFHYIMDKYKPHIYLSEWTAGRFDCGCVYKLLCELLVKNAPKNAYTKPYGINHVEQWQGARWKKIEITVTDYPEGVEGLMFEHQGRDTQFWAGNYGSKMAGGVAKLLFDSIEPLPTDASGNIIPKKFSDVQFVSNGDQYHDNDRFYLNYEDPGGYYGGIDDWENDEVDYIEPDEIDLDELDR